MHKLIITTEHGKIIETIKIKSKLQDFILYRGRLLKRKLDNYYVEKDYLEID